MMSVVYSYISIAWCVTRLASEHLRAVLCGCLSDSFFVYPLDLPQSPLVMVVDDKATQAVDPLMSITRLETG